jgi:hypothetical protein
MFAILVLVGLLAFVEIISTARAIIYRYSPQYELDQRMKAVTR